MSGRMSDVVRCWTELGRDDPLRAALTSGGGPGWDVGDFLRTGRDEIDAVLRLLRRRGAVPERGTALDFGCGPGRLSAGLAHAGFRRVIGVDVSESMLAKAREIVHDARCEFRIDTSPDLRSVPTGSADLVYSSRVLQHLPAELALGYVGEFLRVTAPGGIVVFQLPAGPARGPAGQVLRVLPDVLLNRLRAGMQMHGTPPDVVGRVVAEAGGTTVAVEDDTSAGPRWRSHLYVVRPGG